MLAKPNRIRATDDFRATMRRGVKVVGANTVTYVRSGESGAQARFGFVVSKQVGNAVRRNLVRRRLKAACFELVAGGYSSADLVIRALPAASDASWQTLRAEVARARDVSERRRG